MALFYYVFINRTIETVLETLLQFGFTQKALLGDLCDCQRMKEMVVNDLPCLHQTAVVLSEIPLSFFCVPTTSSQNRDTSSNTFPSRYNLRSFRSGGQSNNCCKTKRIPGEVENTWYRFCYPAGLSAWLLKSSIRGENRSCSNEMLKVRYGFSALKWLTHCENVPHCKLHCVGES